ncbi:glycerol-3-phosphate responsive antiterminator [Sporomusa acidovorans]|uniref:Glycerol-3-phosphate responsive antiterminator n=1 Tax=Sporomusa acidovorans (strain ATCC 49682 / DSM 3132 / Mol) TaxID=1123286 RepID=A0ABZ3IXQ1_SPOA4|nr:glycerol-3-phosphate responsive antiterminator [Sporomusa acidovorans]OZC23307.1 glycerol-3-phosphate responsive antiterminator [Sporomusa acidovorans DSM 3132]SDE41355.1 glycerol uptake operon antiterminator [Sporomusa acidovorans]
MLSQEKVLAALRECPIIASLQKPEMITTAINSSVRIVMISSGDIFNIGEISQSLRKHNKLVLVHVDMIGGMARDKVTIRYLKEKLDVDGIVTPNGQLVASGHKEGLLTAQRIFAHDTPSVVSGINALRQSKPDFIEIMPGAAVLKVYEEVRRHFQQPIIAAGLIKNIQDVKQILKAGAVGADTSTPSLWNFSIAKSTTERLS